MAKREHFRNLMPEKEPSEIDWARLAAFIDGEGCIRITERKNPKWKRAYLSTQIVVANTDPKLPVWLKATLGGAVYERKHNQSHPRAKYWANCLSWVISAAMAKHVLECCMPYFIIKRDQAETALAFQATLGHLKGNKKTPPEVIERQYQFKQELSELKGRASRPAGFRERNKTMEQIVPPDGLVTHRIN